MLKGRCKVILIGSATEDGVVRYTPAGTPVLRFSLATDTGSTKRGESKPSPDWHRVVVSGPQVEDRDNEVRKGCTCYVEGTLRTRGDGKKPASRRITEVCVGLDGSFRVYHTHPPSAQDGSESTRATSSSTMMRTVRPSGSRQATPPHSPNGEPSATETDAEWLSFEGLLLNDHADTFD